MFATMEKIQMIALLVSGAIFIYKLFSPKSEYNRKENNKKY